MLNGGNAIIVFVDELPEYAYAVPCNDKSDAVDSSDIHV